MRARFWSTYKYTIPESKIQTDKDLHVEDGQAGHEEEQEVDHEAGSSPLVQEQREEQETVNVHHQAYQGYQVLSARSPRLWVHILLLPIKGLGHQMDTVFVLC